MYGYKSTVRNFYDIPKISWKKHGILSVVVGLLLSPTSPSQELYTTSFQSLSILMGITGAVIVFVLGNMDDFEGSNTKAVHNWISYSGVYTIQLGVLNLLILTLVLSIPFSLSVQPPISETFAGLDIPEVIQDIDFNFKQFVCGISLSLYFLTFLFFIDILSSRIVTKTYSR